MVGDDGTAVRNRDAFDLVVFNVRIARDQEVYEQLMRVYFPPDMDALT